jgi:uncharacterized Tic20 family protein
VPVYGRPGHVAYGQAEHPQAATALILGLLSTVGTLFCGVTILLSPIAIWMGAKVRREIDAQPGTGGRGQATAGFVLGIVGMVLLVLAIALVVLVVAVGLSSEPDYSVTDPGTSASAAR